MKKYSFIALLLILFSQSASAYLNSWSGQSPCGLDEYIREFNKLNPAKEMFIEDVSRMALADTEDPPVIRIDKDLQSEALAGDVVKCMVGGYVKDSLESTLTLAYKRYFYDRAARRALWTFFSVLDDMYLNKGQRVESIQLRDSGWNNYSKAAKWGVVVASVAFVIANRFRGTIPMASARPSAALTEGLNEAERTAMLQSLERSITFRQLGQNVGVFAKTAAISGVTIGSPIWLARSQGWIATRDNTSQNIVELTYHRMHWLELDCRARAIEANLNGRVYDQGTNDPLFKEDVRTVNHLVNDFDFLTDVSQLYYVEFQWPSDMQWDANNVTYKDIKLHCQGGFSKKEVPTITAGDVRVSVANTGKSFLKLYGTVTAEPLKIKINAFLEKYNAEIKAAFEDKKTPADFKEFFTTVNPKLASFKETGAARLLQMVTAQTGTRNHDAGREDFYKKFEDLTKALKPETMAEMDKLVKEVIARLPASLMNEAILEVSTNNERFPGNLIFLMELGLGLDAASKTKPPVISDIDQFLLPHELMFYFYGPFKKEAPPAAAAPKTTPKEPQKK
jgi:hypothetical protein